MSLKRLLLSLPLILLPITSHAFFMSGSELSRRSVEYLKYDHGEKSADMADAVIFKAYVLGVVDARETVSLYCFPRGVDGGQVSAVVAKYIALHPEDRHLVGDLLVLKAVISAFPCKTP